MLSEAKKSDHKMTMAMLLMSIVDSLESNIYVLERTKIL